MGMMMPPGGGAPAPGPQVGPGMVGAPPQVPGGAAPGGPNPWAAIAALASAKKDSPPNRSPYKDLSDEIPIWVQIVDAATRALEDAISTGEVSKMMDLEADIREHVMGLKKLVASASARYKGIEREGSSQPAEPVGQNEPPMVEDE